MRACLLAAALFLPAPAPAQMEAAKAESARALREAAASGPAAAEAPGEIEAGPVTQVGSYRFLQLTGYPDGLGRGELQALIQRFVDHGHGKSFRRLGDEHDFDHGHFLYARESFERPVAILWHTQEHASRFSRTDPGGPYDYVDRMGRNWIQFLDPDKPIENARAYERAAYPEGERWDRWRSRSSKESPYTLHAPMLDHARLGIEPEYTLVDFTPPEPNFFMFRFARVPCGSLPSPLPEDADVIEVSLPAGEGQARERVCLKLGV